MTIELGLREIAYFIVERKPLGESSGSQSIVSILTEVPLFFSSIITFSNFSAINHLFDVLFADFEILWSHI